MVGVGDKEISETEINTNVCIKTQFWLILPGMDDLHMRGWQIPVMPPARASSQRRRLSQCSWKDWGGHLPGDSPRGQSLLA